MRVGIQQSIWMYGFPTRKHHYDRGLSRRQSSLDRYGGTGGIPGELKFVEGHPIIASHSPVKSNFSVNKTFASSTVSPIKGSTDRGQLNGRLPAHAHVKCQQQNVSNGFVQFNSDNVYSTSPSTAIFNTAYNNYGANETPSWCRYDSREYHVSRYYNPYQTTGWGPVPNVIEDTKYNSLVEIEEPQLVDIVGLPPAKARFDVVKTQCQTAQHSKSLNRTESNNGSSRNLRRSLDGKNVFDLPASLPTTSLLKAVKEDDINGALELLDMNVQENINATDNSGRTVLSHAVLKGNLSLLEKILKFKDIDVNKPDNEGNTPLHFAVQAGQMEAVSLLLNTCSELDIDGRNHLGFTALMKAALQGRTKCAKMLLFAGASPTMRDTGRGLRAEQWARLCGRYVCADVIEKYARNQLLSKSTSYGNWGSEPELGLHFVNGKLQPPAIGLQNAINRTCQQNNSIKSKIKKAFYSTTSTRNGKSNTKITSFSLVSQLTTAALCVSSPVLPNSSRIPPMVKSILKPFVIPKIEITPDGEDCGETSTPTSKPEEKPIPSNQNFVEHQRRRLSSFVKLRKK